MSINSFYYKHYVYKMSFPDGRYYIGCTYNLARRLHNHELSAMRYYQYKNNKLYNAIIKHGFDRMDFEILSVCKDRTEGRVVESVIINKHKNDSNMLNRFKKIVYKPIADSVFRQFANESNTGSGKLLNELHEYLKQFEEQK